MNQQQVEISSEQFKAWTESEVTKRVVKQVIDMREQLSNYLATGKTVSNTPEYTTDRIVGRIEGITELFNLFGEVKEETHDYDH